MSLEQSEAIVLRSYPLREADLLVTLFTRRVGKLRGVAKAAKRSRRRFGGALEPLTRVQLYYEQRERQELVRIDSCEVLESPLAMELDYPRLVALEHVAEVLDELLPDHEANDDVFRLAASVLEALGSGPIWTPVTYFELWMVRLTGFLPELGECMGCGRSLEGARAWFHPMAEGLMCERDRRLASTEMPKAARALAGEMLRAPVNAFSRRNDGRLPGRELRRFLVQRMERHLEKKLVTAGMLEKLE